MTSKERASEPERLPRTQIAECLGRGCMFITKVMGEAAPCEGVKLDLVARTCFSGTDEPPSFGVVRYAVYSQHCPEREQSGQGDAPIGHTVRIFDHSVSPGAAIQAAEAFQAEELPISLSYGNTSLVEPIPAEMPAALGPEHQT